MNEALKNFTTAQLKAALAKPWSTAAAKDISDELKSRVTRKAGSPRLAKKNPSYRYLLCAQKPKGKKMCWNGDRFTDNEPFKSFAKNSAAMQLGKQLVKRYPILQ